MGVKLNLTQADIKKAQGIFEPLPVGIYGGVVYEAKDAISKSSGNPMYTVTFKITEGVEGVGRRLTAYYAHSEKAWFKARELFKATELTEHIEAIESGEGEFPEAEVLLGIEVNIKVGQEEYESVDDDGNDVTKTRNTVDRVSVYNADKIDTEDGAAPTGGGAGFIGL